jgi:vancomycin resistance protein VanJ
MGESTGFTHLLLVLPAALLLLPPLLLLVVAKGRGPAAWWALGTIGFVLLVPMGPVWSPRTAPAADLRVMTLNAYMLQRGLDRVEEGIRRERPDIVLLQEAGSPAVDDDRRRIRERFPDYHAAGDERRMVLSRHPILQSGAVEVPPRWEHSAYRCLIDVRGRPVAVYSVHLLPNLYYRPLPKTPWGLLAHFRTLGEERHEQATDLLARVREERAPVVLGGDFNMVPRGQVYRRYRRELRDAFAERGRGYGYTIPNWFPLRRIDWILIRDLEPVRCWTAGRGESDHRAVVADLRWSR